MILFSDDMILRKSKDTTKNYQSSSTYLVKLLDEKLIYRNLLYFYRLTMEYQKQKLRKVSYLPLHQKMLLLLLLSRFSRVQLCATPQMAAHQAHPSLGFSRQEHWSGLPLPFPVHESEVAQSCPTPSDPMDCSLPGSSVHSSHCSKQTNKQNFKTVSNVLFFYCLH